MKFKADGLVIIGYGNSLRGDDGAGPRVARELRRCGLPAIEAHQLTPELAIPVSRAQLAIFVDADSALQPGQVRIRPVADSVRSPFEHFASPASVLRMAQEAFGRSAAGLSIAIGGESFALGRRLSRPALRAVREVVNVCMNRV